MPRPLHTSQTWGEVPGAQHVPEQEERLGRPCDDERDLAPARARDRAALGLPAAEERLEDVLEAEATAHPAAGGGRVAAHVVGAALLRVRQDLVGAGHVLELVLGLRTGDVRVELAREPAVRLLDLVLAGVPGDAEDLVVVSH